MGKSKSETKQQQTVTPTLPGFAVRGISDQQQRIQRLGQRDPREFVAPASPLQKQAFALGGGLASRMGAPSIVALSTMRPSEFERQGIAATSVPSINGAQQFIPNTGAPAGALPAGAQQINVADIGKPDYTSYVKNQPDLMAGYNSIKNGGFGPNLPASYDANGDGRLQIDEFGRFHDDRFGSAERAQGNPMRKDVPAIGGVSPTAQQAQPLQARDQVTGAAIGQVGAAELTSPNPNDMFAGAGLLAANVGMSGANTVDDVALSRAGLLGPAQGYGASGPAGVERAQATLGQAQGRAGVSDAQAALAQTSGQAAVTQGQAGGAASVQGFDAAGAAPVTNAQAATLGQAQGYDATTADARGFNATMLGQNLLGYDPATGQAVSAGPAAQGQANLVGDLPTMDAAQIGQGDIDRFMNPYLNDVVAATQADMAEQFGQQRAALDARAAGAGAFGGSRFGVREAQLDGEQSRALGSTLGGLRADGFNTALNFADRDVGRRQQANQANFNLQGQRAFANADALNRFELANMDAQNQFALTDAAAQNQFGLANMDALNAAGAFGADARNRGLLADMDASNQAAQFGAAADNQASLANAGLLSDADRFGADAANEFDRLNQQAAQQVGLANADASNRAGLDFVGRQDAANLFSADAANVAGLDAARRGDAMTLANMDAQNRAALDAAGRADAMGQFNADSLNRVGLSNADARNRAALDAVGRADAMTMANVGEANRVGLSNADAINRSLLDFAGRADSAGQFNADAMNRFGLAQFDADTQANFRNADALNNMSQFNAGQQDTALARRLQAAGLLGDLGATVGAEDRANIGLLSDLGNQQREIDRAFRNADPTMVQLLGQLQAMQDLGLLQGQTSSGTSTTTESQNAAALGAALGGMWLSGGGGNPFS